MTNHVLENEINQYLRKGFSVVSRTEVAAQLVKPKEFGCLLPVVLLLLGGFPFIVYLILYLNKKNNSIYLSLKPDGSLSRTDEHGRTENYQMNLLIASIVFSVVVCLCFFVLIFMNTSGA